MFCIVGRKFSWINPKYRATILVPNDLESLIYGKKYSIFDIYYNKITYNEQIFFTYVVSYDLYDVYSILAVFFSKLVQTAVAWSRYTFGMDDQTVCISNIFVRIFFVFALGSKKQRTRLYLLCTPTRIKISSLCVCYLFCQKKKTNYIIDPQIRPWTLLIL